MATNKTTQSLDRFATSLQGDVSKADANIEQWKVDRATRAGGADKGWSDQDWKEYQGLMAEADAARKRGLIGGDIQAGSRFGESILREGLGRATTSTKLGRAQEKADLARLRDSTVQDIESRFQDMSQGMSSEEELQRRERGIESINRATQSGSRQLQGQLARFGVKGGMAGAALGDVQRAGMSQKASFERDLNIMGRDAKRQGLLDLANFSVQTRQFDINQSNLEKQLKMEQERYNLGQESSERGLQIEQERFNLAQAAKEKDIILQSSLGFAGLGSIERGGDKAAAASLAAANTQAGCFLAGTLIIMEDGSYKPIEEIKVGQRVYGGGEVTISGACYANSDIYTYRKEIVSAHHIVYEDHKVLEIKDSPLAKKTFLPKKTLVYALDAENHYYVTNHGVISAGFAKVEGSYSPENDLKLMNKNKDLLHKMEETKWNVQSGHIETKISDTLKSGLNSMLGVLGIKKLFLKVLLLLV